MTSRVDTPPLLPSNAVTWYEFLLDGDLLVRHLTKSNPEPSGTQLIIQFLQHAEDGNTAEDNEVGTVGQEAINPVRNKKSRALKLLALKTAAFYKWNLNLLETKLPFLMLKTLLSELLEATTDANPGADHTQFSLQLWHRWSLRSLVRASFPPKPSKGSNIAVPGLTEMVIPVLNPPEVEIKTLLETSNESVAYLEKCSTRQNGLVMPNMSCFGELNETVDKIVYSWGKGTPLQAEDVITQVCYDLGSFYFYKEEYAKALVNFNRVEECLPKLATPLYTNVEEAKLRGYSSACRCLQHVSGTAPSLIVRLEESRGNSYQGVVNILLEDNSRPLIPFSMRKAVQEDILTIRPELYAEVFICNTIREVSMGRCVLSDFAATIDRTEASKNIRFLIQACERVVVNSGDLQKQNIKCFLRYLSQTLPRESGYVTNILQSSLKSLFSLKEIERLCRPGNDLPTGVIQSSPVSASLSKDDTIELGARERQLIITYDPKEVVGLVNELSQTMKTLQMVSLSDKWVVPRDIRQVLNSLDASPALLAVHILVAKGKQCIDKCLLDSARLLYTEALNVVKETCHALTKLLRWEVLLTDLLALQERQDDTEKSTLELSKQVKACLTALRLETDILPRSEIVAECSAYLVNMSDWSYLCNLGNSRNGHIEFCRLLSEACKEIPDMKACRKPAKELWDALVQIFTMQAQTKRSSSGTSNVISRDSQLGIMSPAGLTQFLPSIKQPVSLALLISCLTKLYGMVKDDSNYEICSEFVSLWPSALTSSVNVPTLTDCVNILMAHALATDPTHSPWFKTQADIYYGSCQYSSALRCYLECGIIETDYFSKPLPRYLFDDQTFKKMLKSCINLQCFTQAAVLCQFLDETDYTTAFKVLQEKTSLDAMDGYYACIWDPTLLEFIIHLHNRMGEVEKKQIALQAIAELELNSSNPEEVLHKAAERRKRKFLQTMAKQYL